MYPPGSAMNDRDYIKQMEAGVRKAVAKVEQLKSQNEVLSEQLTDKCDELKKLSAENSILRRDFVERGEIIQRFNAERSDLIVLLAEAIETIKVFHGPDAWDIYYNDAPEMKRFRAAVSGREEHNDG